MAGNGIMSDLGNVGAELLLTKVSLILVKKSLEMARYYGSEALRTPALQKTRCFREAYTGLPVVRATENENALNCVVLKYSIPVSEE